MIFVYIFAGLILTLLLVAALLPKNYLIEQSIVIKQPVSEVQKKVVDFNAYSTWNPWQKSDPGAVKTISGVPGNPGHKYEWSGKKVGAGSLTLKHVDDRHVNIDLQFLKPWKTLAKDSWLFEPWGDGSETKVTWQNSGELPWPIARLMGPLLNKSLNQQFKTGLANMKQMSEGTISS
jgi:hypothetical protein